MTKRENLNQVNQEELEDRQTQFSSLYGVDPELFRGLKFCSSCKGFDYQWTDWSMTEVDGQSLGLDTWEDVRDYRCYIAQSMCKVCDGTGFEEGSFKMSRQEWLELSALGPKKERGKSDPSNREYYFKRVLLSPNPDNIPVDNLFLLYCQLENNIKYAEDRINAYECGLYLRSIRLGDHRETAKQKLDEIRAQAKKRFDQQRTS
jgi:hypothetical protein